MNVVLNNYSGLMYGVFLMDIYPIVLNEWLDSTIIK